MNVRLPQGLCNTLLGSVILLGLASSTGFAAAAEALSVTDHMTRTHQLDAAAVRVAAAGAPAEILLYTLVPERMVGWNRELTPAARRFIPEDLQPRVRIRNLPDAEDTSLDAEFIALQPELIVDYGILHTDYMARADAVQARLDIPFVMFDGALERIPEVYRTLGPLVGAEARAQTLAELAEELLQKYKGFLADTAQARAVYLATSADGLMPAFVEDSAYDVLAWLGLPNAAGSIDAVQRFPLEFSDVAAWQPDTIFATNAGLAELIATDAQWQSLPAVQQRRVYLTPRLPFDWVARPPSVNRLLGLVWVAMTLSPDLPRDGFEQDLRRIFASFLHRELSDSELRELTGAPAFPGALGKQP